MVETAEIIEQKVDPKSRENEAVSHFRTALEEGQDWFDALLAAIGLWTIPHEVYAGREYTYLIGGEAFDWLLLTERLLQGVDGLVPEDEGEKLLFHGRPPREITEEEFQERIGAAKHRAVMNYWYGVRVEEALILAVEHEARKASRGITEPEGGRLDDIVHQRIYGKTRTDLLREFFAERQEILPDRVSLSELREFTYWLFKYRVNRSEPARLASDTKKGLEYLQRLWKGTPPCLDLTSTR